MASLQAGMEKVLCIVRLRRLLVNTLIGVIGRFVSSAPGSKAALRGLPEQQVGGVSRAFRKLTSMVDGVQRQATPWPDWAVTTEIDTSVSWAMV